MCVAKTVHMTVVESYGTITLELNAPLIGCHLPGMGF